MKLIYIIPAIGLFYFLYKKDKTNCNIDVYNQIQKQIANGDSCPHLVNELWYNNDGSLFTGTVPGNAWSPFVNGVSRYKGANHKKSEQSLSFQGDINWLSSWL